VSRGARPAAQRFLYYVGEIIIGIEPAKSKHQALVIGPLSVCTDNPVRLAISFLATPSFIICTKSTRDRSNLLGCPIGGGLRRNAMGDASASQ